MPQLPLRILIAPSGFKESLGADEVADCIETGIRRAVPDAVVTKLPLMDGGEGFARALVGVVGGELREVRVTGPVGEAVDAYFGLLEGEGPLTAALEMSAAAGLRLVPRDLRDPLQTTTYGVGELIRAALDAGARRILVGCGDSGTNDGGAGMAQALGVRLLDEAGEDLPAGGQHLQRLAHIDLSGRDPRLQGVQIEVACNWTNVLTGEKGVARVFGPQKGASEETVAALESGLARYAEIIERDLGMDVRELPGSGASGGLGAGLHALLGATLRPRYDVIGEYLSIDDALQDTDLVFTAEGGLDFQTPRGKIPVVVAQKAKELDLPVVALAGTIGQGAEVNYEHGIDVYMSMLGGPISLPEAIEAAPNLLADAAECAVRLMVIGRNLWKRLPRDPEAHEVASSSLPAD